MGQDEKGSIRMAVNQLQPLLKSMGMARNRFVYGLDRTPDDRLGWSPGGEAKTPLAVAGRLAAFLGFFSHLLETGSMPERPSGPMPVPESRAAAKSAVEAAFRRLEAQIQGLSEGDLARPMPTPWGTSIPALEMLWFVNSITGYWQGQLNYIQTAYGDTDPNMPPDWGQE
jgi:DinB superfamily